MKLATQSSRIHVIDSFPSQAHSSSHWQSVMYRTWVKDPLRRSSGSGASPSHFGSEFSGTHSRVTRSSIPYQLGATWVSVTAISKKRGIFPHSAHLNIGISSSAHSCAMYKWSSSHLGGQPVACATVRQTSGVPSTSITVGNGIADACELMVDTVADLIDLDYAFDRALNIYSARQPQKQMPF